MGQLTTSVRSAVAVADWLQSAGPRLAAPLASLRLLLSPSPDERANVAGADEAEPATRENIRQAALAWRQACVEDPDNVAFFYFAGHGVERTPRDSVLLAADFGADDGNPLNNAVDVNNLFGGMAAGLTNPSMAHTQLWFVDACRVYPSEFRNFETLHAPPVFAVELPRKDRRCAPIYYGAGPGSEAYALTGDRTMFSLALLDSLERCGGRLLEGRNKWVVTVDSLLQGMRTAIERLNAEKGLDQEVWDGGQMQDHQRRIVDLPGVPEVDVRLELVPAADGVSLAFSDPDGEPVPMPDPLDPNPFVDRWTAGSYELRTRPELAGVEGRVAVKPPSFDWQANVR
jgi:Caspase domain